MKTFKDLVFKNHSGKIYFGDKAIMMFDNGFGVKVFRWTINTYYFPLNLISYLFPMPSSRSAWHGPWEVRLLKANSKKKKDYEPIDNVTGYLTENNVTDLMARVQQL